MDLVKENIYFVRYRFTNDGTGIHVREFNNEYDAYHFYQSLENCSLKAMVLKTTRVFITPLLFEGSGFND